MRSSGGLAGEPLGDQFGGVKGAGLRLRVPDHDRDRQRASFVYFICRQYREYLVGYTGGVVIDIRTRLGELVFQRVAGSEGPARRDRIRDAEGERWFAEDRPIRVVHGDSAMFVGGLRALLLQSLHPLAMAGVAAHSGYRGDPVGTAAAHQLLPRRHDLRGRGRRARRRRARAAGASAGARHGPGRPPVRGQRPAPAALGACRGGRQLPRHPPALRVASAGRCRTRRVCRRHRTGRPRPGRGRSAGERGRAGRCAGRVPSRTARHARGARRGPLRAAAPAAACRRARALRRAGERCRGLAAGMGPVAAASAVPAAHRGHGGPSRRRRRRAHAALGDDAGRADRDGPLHS